MDDLPEWSKRLRSIYVRLRLGKRNKALRRKYYREIQKEKLRLAEQGINQEKIRQVCRYLSETECVRNYQCEFCSRIRSFLFEPEFQLVLVFSVLG